MKPYHKIDSIYKRDQKGNFLLGEWSCPEFEYLADAQWRATEKVDGTNVRVNIQMPHSHEEVTVTYGGRSDNAQMPVFLMAKLREIFEKPEHLKVYQEAFCDIDDQINITFYGEGYGAKIQKGGGNYISDGVDFILFDVKAGDWWLLPEAVTVLGGDLNLTTVPYLGDDTLLNWINIVEKGQLYSHWPKVSVEGLVLTPTVSLFNRKGSRIISKMKGKDFK